MTAFIGTIANGHSYFSLCDGSSRSWCRIGSYIGAMANIDPDCKIGQFCIVNNHANISHDSILHDGCHVCGGAQIAGHCRIGKCAMQGIGSCMIEDRSIGDYTVIEAGSVVITDIPANVTAVGCPAKVLK